MKRNILVIDIGGTSVKLMISKEERRKFPSGNKFAPSQLASRIEEAVADWKYDAVAIGFPSPIRDGKVLKDPRHLGPGWVGFDFEKALGKPTRLINDASLQALGSYHGERMLFLGLGTGLGSALLWDHNVLPLELGHLPYDDATIEDVVGKRGLQRIGRKMWEREVRAAIKQLKISFVADYVVVGGGNAKRLDSLPEGVELGHNRNAFLGGCRLWETNPRTRRPKWNVIS